jgi:hypothetical protein
MTDVWTEPPDRNLEERISPDIWNTNIAANLRLLSTHVHTGAAGDGGLMAPNLTLSGPKVYSIPNGFDATGVGQIAAVANQVKWFRFYQPFKLSFSTITVEVTTLQAGTTMGVGIYNTDGTTKLADGTASSAATGVKRIAVTTTVLDVGFYLLAWTDTNTTAAARVFQGGGGNIFVDTNPQMGTAATAATAGVLPASLGVLTGTGIAPVFAKLEGS